MKLACRAWVWCWVATLSFGCGRLLYDPSSDAADTGVAVLDAAADGAELSDAARDGATLDAVSDAASVADAGADADVGAFEVSFSLATDRSSPRPLAGAILTGIVYIHLSGDVAGLSRVQWRLDAASATGPSESESEPPFDFVSDMPEPPLPFHTGFLTDGAHVMLVSLLYDDASTGELRADFQTANTLSGLVVSTSPHRADPRPLTGATLSGLAYVSVAPRMAVVESVVFYLDDPMQMGAPHRTDGLAPYDLEGPSGAHAFGEARPLNTSALVPGAHDVTAVLFSGGVPRATLTAVFDVVP